MYERVDPYSEHGLLNHLHITELGDMSKFSHKFGLRTTIGTHTWTTYRCEKRDFEYPRCPVCGEVIPRSTITLYRKSDNAFTKAAMACQNCGTCLETDPFIQSKVDNKYDPEDSLVGSYYVDDIKELPKYIDEKVRSDIDNYSFNRLHQKLLKLRFVAIIVACCGLIGYFILSYFIFGLILENHDLAFYVYMALNIISASFALGVCVYAMICRKFYKHYYGRTYITPQDRAERERLINS